MKKIYSILMMMTLLLTTAVLTGCSSDDEQPSSVELQSFVIGKWKSHHLTAYTTDGKEVSQEITKNNAFSSVYCELTFQRDGKVISEGWKQNIDGSSTWMEDIDTYTVSGDFVFVKVGQIQNGWNEGLSFNIPIDGNAMTRANNTTITLSLDRKNNMLFLRETESVHGVQMTANLYFIKQ